MSLFGWSLPPGCGRLPGEEPVGPCSVCGGDPESDTDKGGCICPECPECGSFGDPTCYADSTPEQLRGYQPKEHHGLRRTPEQIELRRLTDEQIAKDQVAEAAAWERSALEHGEAP